MSDTTTPADGARRQVEQEVAERTALADAAADMAHRDDLARIVAREWHAFREEWGGDSVGAGLETALNRLAAAYGTGEQT